MEKKIGTRVWPTNDKPGSASAVTIRLLDALKFVNAASNYQSRMHKNFDDCLGIYSWLDISARWNMPFHLKAFAAGTTWRASISRPIIDFLL